MPRFGPQTAELTILSYKDGLLSAIAHDLKMVVRRFEVVVSDDRATVEARIDPTSLEVVCAVRQGQDDPGALSGSDKRKIQTNIRKDVLHTSRHPEIVFKSTGVSPGVDGFMVQGELALHGRVRPLMIALTLRDGQLRGQVRLNQPDYGIKPYKALMGTLKVKPHVAICITLPALN